MTATISEALERAQTTRYVSFGPDIDVAAYKDGGSSCPVVLAVNKKIYQ